MDEQDRWVAEEYLVDLDAARAFAAELVDGVTPAPGRLKILRGAAEELNWEAAKRSRELGLEVVLHFRARPVYRWTNLPIPADAYETDWEPQEELAGYELIVEQVTWTSIEEHRRHVLARRAERQRVQRREALRSRRFLRGPRRRGAGRPGHRGGLRANAPPSDDDDGEPEPPPLARRAAPGLLTAPELSALLWALDRAPIEFRARAMVLCRVRFDSPDDWVAISPRDAAYVIRRARALAAGERRAA